MNIPGGVAHQNVEFPNHSQVKQPQIGANPLGRKHFRSIILRGWKAEFGGHPVIGIKILDHPGVDHVLQLIMNEFAVVHVTTGIEVAAISETRIGVLPDQFAEMHLATEQPHAILGTLFASPELAIIDFFGCFAAKLYHRKKLKTKSNGNKPFREFPSPRS